MAQSGGGGNLDISDTSRSRLGSGTLGWTMAKERTVYRGTCIIFSKGVAILSTIR